MTEQLEELTQEEFDIADRSRVKRAAKRASYVKKDVYQLVDELKLGHVGFTIEGQVFVIPITLWRVDNHLYFHVVNKSRLQKFVERGGEVCISFAECQEWVMSKSAYHHSANYRSAVVYCTGERVVEQDQFDNAFKSVINQLEEGRWDQIRPPSPIERKATALMKLTIVNASYKSRTGGPTEEPEDMALPVWHGVKPAGRGVVEAAGSGQCPFSRADR